MELIHDRELISLLRSRTEIGADEASDAELLNACKGTYMLEALVLHLALLRLWHEVEKEFPRFFSWLQRLPSRLGKQD